MTTNISHRQLLNTANMQERERLILTRGPYLTFLELSIPLLEAENHKDGMHFSVFLNTSLTLSLNVATLTGRAIDLGSCTGLETLVFTLTPHFSAYKHAGLLKSILISWKSQSLTPSLILRLYPLSIPPRRRIVDILHGLNPITEMLLQKNQEVSASKDSENRDCVKAQLHIQIHDDGAEKEWWWNQLEKCFPAWAQLGRLHLIRHKYVATYLLSAVPFDSRRILIYFSRNYEPFGPRHLSGWSHHCSDNASPMHTHGRRMAFHNPGFVHKIS